MLQIDPLLAPRTRAISVSGIRRIFELGATLKDPINLSIGQPDFMVPEPVKQAAIDAIAADQNAYSVTQGEQALRDRCSRHLAWDLGWPETTGRKGDPTQTMIVAGTSAALFLVMQAVLGAGDEIVMPDPYFVAYPNMALFAGGVPVLCDTYPDLRMTAERVEPLITEKTKAVLHVSPSNPGGVVATEAECRDLLELCRSKGVLLISDEIYDEFTFGPHRVETPAGPRCPSPARFSGAHEDVLVVRGFGKTYGCTGWRMGYTAGPARLIAEMGKLQQYSWVCAPTPLQHGCMAAFDVDMGPTVSAYEGRARLVQDKLGHICHIPAPGGAFYAFVEIPDKLGMTGNDVFEAGLEENLLVIPGGVFSERDTHFRISYATAEDKLAQGLDILARMLGG